MDLDAKLLAKIVESFLNLTEQWRGLIAEYRPDAAVRVTQGTATAVGGVDSAVEGDLRRDDEIGLLFAGSFKLPAPAMPGETESLV